MSRLDPIYLSVARRDAVPDLGYPLVEDIHHGIGPIGGIHAALRRCPEDALLVIACDMPNMSPEIVSLLIDSWERSPIPAVIQEADGQLCPTAAIYTQACLPVIEEMINRHQFKIVELFSHVAFRAIQLPTAPDAQSALMNINTAEDYKQM
jgi:molybdopterin-guanine dinucleotide biosynthesis protein A